MSAADMIELKTAELSGPALRYAVMIAIGGELRAEHAPLEGRDYQRVALPAGLDDHGLWFEAAHPAWAGTAGCRTWRPDESWAQGGPLIAQHKVSIAYHNCPDCTPMACLSDTHPAFECGETVLIAACRAIVAAKLGDTVRVPAALVGGEA